METGKKEFTVFLRIVRIFRFFVFVWWRWAFGVEGRSALASALRNKVFFLAHDVHLTVKESRRALKRVQCASALTIVVGRRAAVRLIAVGFVATIERDRQRSGCGGCWSFCGGGCCCCCGCSDSRRFVKLPRSLNRLIGAFGWNGGGGRRRRRRRGGDCRYGCRKWAKNFQKFFTILKIFYY